jgi:hypothetical protein
MRCRKCACELTDDSRFCSQCGAAIEADETAEAEAAGHAPEAGVGGSALVIAAPALPSQLSGRALTGVIVAETDSNAVTDAGGVSGNPRRLSRRLNAHSVHALLTQANLHRIRGQFTEAIDCCVAVLRAQSGNVTAHSLLGDIYRDQGKMADAIQWYRMALDLRPNPSDQAKLAELERQQVAEIGRTRATRRGAAGADPLAAATGLNTGTSNLMGVSPRRWLRGIWIASLSFLVIVLASLIALRSPQARNTPNKSKSGFPVNAGFSSATGLPPLDLQRHLAGNRSQPLISSASSAGNATAADGSAGQQRTGAESGGAAAAGSAIPTAPVLDVRPLTDQTDAAAGAVSRAPHDNSVADTHDLLQPMALTGNLRLGEVRYIGNNAAAVFVNAPQELASDASDGVRDLLIRNIYRAARTVFAQNGIYNHVTVFVQATVPAAGGDAALVEADVDRQAAIAAAPDTDTLNSLVSRLQSVKWSIPIASGNDIAPNAVTTDNGPSN